MNSLSTAAKVSFVTVMSSAALMWFTFVSVATAHEVLPAIADVTQDGDVVTFDVRLNIETLVAGIDAGEITDTDAAPEAAEYDALRALDPAALDAAFRDYWPQMADGIRVMVDGTAMPVRLTDVNAGPLGDIALPRQSEVTFVADLPAGATDMSFGWDRSFGDIAMRQMGVELPYDALLQGGATSDVFSLSGGSQSGPFETFFDFIPVGFDHIVPKGLDHILFVLGLFFLSTRMRPLIWQVSAFTLAHTITLALAALGYVNIPGSIVEPLIAASIIYVAIENLFTDGLSPWRPFLIFGFGLLHGLGFAAVLAEFGLPEANFIPALIGFNIGVEVGQLAVIAVAFVCVMKAQQFSENGTANKMVAAAYLGAMVVAMALIVPLHAAVPDLVGDLVPLLAIIGILLGLSAASVVAGRFDSYREIVAMPGSILIALVATYWFIERVFL